MSKILSLIIALLAIGCGELPKPLIIDDSMKPGEIEAVLRATDMLFEQVPELERAVFIAEPRSSMSVIVLGGCPAKVAGSTVRGKSRIELCPALFERGEAHQANVIMHELIHAMAPEAEHVSERGDVFSVYSSELTELSERDLEEIRQSSIY